MTSPARTAPKPDGNNANDDLYWKLPLVKNHLLATSFETTNNSACLRIQHITQTLSPNTPAAKPSFYRRGWDKTRKFITKKGSYPIKRNK
jgi:hypothetical protein